MKRISRREMIGGAFAASAVIVSRSLRAQQLQTYLPPGVTPKPKGPLVYGEYDQEELDFAYDQRPWAPNFDAVLTERLPARNAATLTRIDLPRRLSYGPTEIEKLDLYASQQTNAPIHVHIHGGAWRGGAASGAAFLSEMFVDAGAHYIAVDFNNVIETNGDLMPMAEQVRRAISWVYRNAESFGGDTNRLFVSGFSSGSHLAAVALTTDWQDDYGLPADMIKGGVLGSGMYDLYPVSLSARNTYINFTDEIVEALSPIRHLENLAAPVVIAHANLETPEFQRQSREFAAVVKTAGKSVTFLEGLGYYHLEFFETLATPYGLLGRAALEQMGL